MSEAIKTGAVTIKKIMLDKNMSVSDLAKEMTNNGYDIKSQILSNKLFRDTFSLNEYILIANILGCDVKTISRDSNIEYINECDEEKEKIKKKNNSKLKESEEQ